MRDIPQHPDCRPSAPPLVSLSALTAVHHAAEDYPSAAPTEFILRLEGFDKGRPCRASGLWPRANPGFGCPCRATHPGLWKGSPRWGLPRRQATSQGAQPPGQGVQPSRSQYLTPHYTRIKGPRYSKEPLCGKGPYCGKEPHCGSRPCRASGLWTRANPGFGRPCRATHPGL